ncbi:MAG: outer membrane beta-barrel protein [Methylacidiphilales bacterium]|nr:outer membrane beta-barrel protein [Candidatus Methylacidiphilales bacterium]
MAGWIEAQLPLAAQDVRAGQTGTGKPFIISVGVREEYDDNINTTSTNRQGSFATIISPDITVNYPMNDTTFTARYAFGGTYYYNRGNDPWDFTHDFSAKVTHQFSDRLSLDVRDEFSYSQSPQIGTDNLIVRRQGNGWINNANGDLTYSWTRRFSTVTGYHNSFNGYEDRQVNFDNEFVQHGVTQDFRLQVLEPTTAVLSYGFDNYDYAHINRDYSTHLFTVGADHYLLREWLVTGRFGAQYVEYENPLEKGGFNPYVSVRTAWFYLPRCTLAASYNLGTDVTDFSSYGSQYRHNFGLSIDHSWTPRFTTGGSISLQFADYSQNQALVAGAGNQNETTLVYDLHAAFAITDWLSVNTGYTYTQVDSGDAARKYERNQVYIGVRGTY